MKSRHIIITCLLATIVVVLGALGVHLLMTPLIAVEGGRPAGDLFDPETRVGQIFKSVSACAHQQKGLFSYIEAYHQKHGRLPDDLKALIDDDIRSLSFTSCPLGHPYVLHPENYGKADAVLISERQNKHKGTLKLWIRGIRPCVQTMGDGTIYMFEDGKLATIQAKND